jgi:hypothetical protein
MEGDMEKVGDLIGKTDLIAKIESIRQKAKERSPVEPPAPAILATSKPMLPLWPESVRGVPNSVLRSALFGAIKRGRRVFIQRELLASMEGLTLLFTGPRLDQADLDVWEQCLHLARTGGLGCRIQFAAYGFLKTINRSTGGKDVEWLKGAFARLASSVVEIKDGKRAYFGAMLARGARDDEIGHYVIEINPEIAALYGTDGWSQIEWEQRQALKSHPLAQWLHGFYSTHTQPFSLKVGTIHRLCGSEVALLSDFKKALRHALKALAAATGWKWEINADLVHIDKSGNQPESQTRRLTRSTLNVEKKQKT